MSECIDHGKVGDKDGYSHIRGTMRHRLVYAKHHGLSVDAIQGKVIRHTCDNPRCINPDHLIIGTHKDNTRDMLVRGRGGRVKLTPSQVDLIRSLRTQGNSYATIAKALNVSKSAVAFILQGRSWNYELS